jgi:hypothetical protein
MEDTKPRHEVTLREHAIMMGKRSRGPIPETRRQLTVARSTLRKMEARTEAQARKIEELAERLASLEAQQHESVAS